MKRSIVLSTIGLGLLASACSIELPNPLDFGTPYIVKGTFEERPLFGGGVCPVFIDQTGVVYHLFQGEAIANADFDAVTTPGAVSRLQIIRRDNLPVGCEQGITVVVEEVLEVIP